MAKQTVALYTVTSGERVERARTSLADALGDAKLSDPDEAGAFEVAVDAESPDAARELVREAFARAGTGDDFVIRESTEGREMPADDPRQGPGADGDGADPAGRVAEAASAVAAAASGAAREAAGSDAAGAARAAASSARDAASGAGGSDRVRQFAPIAGLLVLLFALRRARRR
ncbi:MAG TPA: hypothetical protein VGW75_07795 [Solirubrobacteraceae bacterium]|jgi:hypothetical protein|nr:hypothetical protein [Solirubrobacteraceae bacterium]